MSCTRLMHALFLLFSIHSNSAIAFDPFSVFAVVSGAVGAVEDVAGGLGEVTNTLSEIQGLYEDIDSDAGLEGSSQRTIDEINHLRELAQDVGYSESEISQMLEGSGADLSLSDRISRLRGAIRSARSIMGRFQSTKSKLVQSQLESTDLLREQLGVSYEALRLEQSEALRPVKEKLESEKDRKNKIKEMLLDLERSGARWTSKGEFLGFPKQEVVIDKALAIAMKFKSPLLILAALVVLVRLIFYQLTLATPNHYWDAVRDLFCFYVLVSFFPEIIRALSMGVDSLTHGFSHDAASARIDANAVARMRSPGGWIFAYPLFLNYLFIALKYGFFTVCNFVSTYMIALLVVSGPIVIFCSQMMNLDFGWKAYLSGLLIILCWPILWNAIGGLASELWSQDTQGLSHLIGSTAVSAMQFLSPFLVKMFVKGDLNLRSVSSMAKQGAGIVATGGKSIAKIALPGKA